jgi:septum formation protein
VSKIDSQTRVVLASSSPFRRQLLNQLAIKFDSIAPNIDESALSGESPEVLVRRLAIAKAEAVLEKYPRKLIIGSDQVAKHGNRPVGKPKNYNEAVTQLQASSGKTVTLYTGIALLNAHSGNLQSDVISYQVKFRLLTKEVIQRYLTKEQPYGCCGSLRADGLGIALLDQLYGQDPTALIGLPLTVLVTMLKNEGFDVI